MATQQDNRGGIQRQRFLRGEAIFTRRIQPIYRWGGGAKPTPISISQSPKNRFTSWNFRSTEKT